MKSKQYIALGAAIILLGASAYFSELQFLAVSHPNASAIPPAAQGDTLVALNAISAKPSGVDFTLSAGGKNYNGAVKAGGTVLDAMRALEKSGDFFFTGKEYVGMGFFVESIGGKKNSNDMYWILYMNGQLSDAGVSQTTIYPGDRVEWRYEKGY